MERRYEGLFIIDSELIQEKLEAVLGHITETISKTGGTVDETQRWGKRHLAYPINKRTEGFYYIVYFTIDPQNVKELKRVFRLTEGIVRNVLFVREEDMVSSLEKAKVE